MGQLKAQGIRPPPQGRWLLLLAWWGIDEFSLALVLALPVPLGAVTPDAP